MPTEGNRTPTYPRYNVSRKKPRRWPLVLRLGRGGVHGEIAIPVVLHALIACLIVYLVKNEHVRLGLPSSIVPSLSIVVGLMLVFRNQTSYERFWNGRHNMTTMVSTIRNLARLILTHSSPLEVEGTVGMSSSGEYDSSDETSTLHHSKKLVGPFERADTEKTIRLLLATLYATKHNLRHEWTSSKTSHEPTPGWKYAGTPGNNTPRRWGPLSRNNTSTSVDSTMTSGTTTPLLSRAEYTALLPRGLSNFEEDGLGLPLQLSFSIETYVRRAMRRGWIQPPLASQLSTLVNGMVDAIGRMEQIRTTPVPVAHLYGS